MLDFFAKHAFSGSKILPKITFVIFIDQNCHILSALDNSIFTKYQQHSYTTLIKITKKCNHFWINFKYNFFLTFLSNKICNARFKNLKL